jgi:hypothetical protein
MATSPDRLREQVRGLLDVSRGAPVPIAALARCCATLDELGPDATYEEQLAPVRTLATQMRCLGVSPEQTVVAVKQLLGGFGPAGVIGPKELQQWMEPLISAAIRAYYVAR